MRKPCLSVIAILVLFLTISHLPVFSTDIGAIKDPKPNITETEKQYVQLKKVKTIDAELGNELYLFKPFSITVCRGSGDVFIYDALQSKIFKMDGDLSTVKTSFGKTGIEIGDFGGTGKFYPVFIQMGRDNKLYANDARKRKIIVFNQDGGFIREIKYGDLMLNGPLVDSSGTLYSITVEDKVITAYDEKNTLLFSLSNLGENFNYLFSTPDPEYLKFASDNMAEELKTVLTVGSRFLLFFSSSSTMVILKDKKVSDQFRLWPNDALKQHKYWIDKISKKGGNAFVPMFINLFVDDDNDNMFFLQAVRNEEKKIDTLYQFDDKGQMIKVFYVPFDEGAPFVNIKAINRGKFYAVEKDKITLYQ